MVINRNSPCTTLTESPALTCNQPVPNVKSPTAIGCLSVLLWGCIIPLIKLGTNGLGTLSGLLIVHGIAGTLGIGIMLCRRTFPLRSETYLNRAFLVRALLFTLHMYCLYISISLVSNVGLPGVIFCNYLWPTLVLLYSVKISGLAISRPSLFRFGNCLVISALLLEFGLPALHTQHEWNNIGAFILAIVGANSWGLYSAYTRKTGSISGGAAVTPMFSLGTAGIAALLLLAGVEHQPSENALLWPLVLAGMINVLAYSCWDFGTRHGNIVLLSLTADFIPWLSLFSTSLLLGITIPTHTILSAIILVFGALTTRLGTLPRLTPTQKAQT